MGMSKSISDEKKLDFDSKEEAASAKNRGFVGR